MPFPLAIPVAISAIKALVKFRGRLDTILSLSETTTGLPFVLPPAPKFNARYIDAMAAFFGGELGQGILVIRGKQAQDDWAAVKPDPHSPAVQEARNRLLKLFYESQDIQPEALGPAEDPNRQWVSKGPTTEMRLAYYVVESQRLSRNPALTRILLAAADTLLEFGADNANLVVSDARMQGLVQTFLTEFATAKDWDDAAWSEILKKMLGAATVAAIEHRGELPDKPALQALFGALVEVRKDFTDEKRDFVDNFISDEGLKRLVGRFLTHAADTPGLLPSNAILQPTLAAMLRAAGDNLDTILADPKAFACVLEAGLVAATGPAAALLNKQIGDKQLYAVLVSTLATQIRTAGNQHTLFRDIASGEFLATLYQASLAAIATNPAALANATGMDEFATKLVVALAAELSRIKPAGAFTLATLQSLAVRSLEVLATEPELLAGRNEFAARVIGATLEAAAAALQDGLSAADFIDLATAAVRASADNLALVAMDERWRVVLVAIGPTLSDGELKKITTVKGRKDLFFAALQAVAANPTVWDGLAARQLAQPLVQAILQALATDPTRLLSGPALVPVARVVLLAAARRGERLLTDDPARRVDAATIKQLLTRALAHAATGIGRSIDGETLPGYLERVVLEFLASPMDLADDPEVKAWLEHILSQITGQTV